MKLSKKRKEEEAAVTIILAALFSTIFTYGHHMPFAVAFTGQNVIGYIGCSVTWMSVAGYHQLSIKHLLWPQIPAYSGGSIDEATWANGTSQYWAAYDNQVSLHGQPKTVWVEDCGGGNQTWSMVQQFFAILRQHSPNAIVYMSPINHFVPSSLCSRIADVYHNDNDNSCNRKPPPIR
jgi:hypothetical protein